MRSYAAAAASSDSHAPAPVPAAPAVPGGFEIKIQRIDGSSLRVEVQPDMTGLQLKELIAQKLGISMDMRLICRGRAVKDDDLLGSHVTEAGQIVHMVQRPPAAPQPPGTPQPSPSPAGPPGPPGVMPGMMTNLPFLGQSQVFHIAVPDFMGGLPPGGPPVGPPVGPPPTGPPPGPPGPMGPLPSFGLAPERPPLGGASTQQLMQAVEAAQAAWRTDMPMPVRQQDYARPPAAMAAPQGNAMRGIPLMPTGGFPHPPHVPLPPPLAAPVAAAFGVPPGAPAAAMPPPHFPPMPAPMHVVLQGFPPNGLAQVIPQLLGAEVPAPPRAPSGAGRTPESLPWRDLRRLHSHLTAALGRSSGYRPANLPPDGLTPEAEMRAFLTSLHVATSQLGVAVSDMIQHSETLMVEPPTRQHTQFNLVLGSASRVFRALSSAMSSNETNAIAAALQQNGAAGPAQAPPETGTEAETRTVLAAGGTNQALELLQSFWLSAAVPGRPCPEHLARPYVFALLQGIWDATSEAIERTPEGLAQYPALSALMALR